MKIVSSISTIYQNQLPINELLRDQIDALFNAIKSKQWFYLSRIKALESFAQKLETGRVRDPNKLEDFFACTIVVENFGQIKTAEKLVKKHCKIVYQRPAKSDETHKESHSFVFDDLRIYATLKPTNARKKGPINETVFEIQIKTFLQHAWSIATHNLVYKSDEISWTKQRVAFQVKAMLENAEVSISGAEKVKKLPGVPKINYRVSYQNEVKQFITNSFLPGILPSDLVRLIDSVIDLLKNLRIDLTELNRCLTEENKHGRGVNTLNLSPYLILLQSIINQNPKSVNNFLNSKWDPKTRILIPKEVDIQNIQQNKPKEKVIII